MICIVNLDLGKCFILLASFPIGSQFMFSFWFPRSRRWISMTDSFEGRTDNDIKNKWNAMKRSQERKRVRLSPQMSTLSTKAASTELLDVHLGNISPKKRVTTPLANACIPLLEQEDEENLTEV